MGIVLVHNNATWHYEADARASMLTKVAVRETTFWNLWTTRQSPYKVLEDGMPIVMLESWRQNGGGGLLSWLVTARAVHTGQFRDKNAAIRAIAGWLGETPSWVRANQYTADKRPDAGTAICWRAEPVRRLGLARPSGLRLNQTGWLVTDDAHLASLGVDLALPTGTTSRGTSRKAPNKARSKTSGQGRRLDTAVKDAIEARAVTVATTWCRKQGWAKLQVTKRSDPRPWDIQGTVNGKARYAEVKGTTGGPRQVEVTAGEVKAAKEHGDEHVMLIVHGITVDLHGGAPRATGGELVNFDPWSPRKSELIETRYTWRPSGRENGSRG